MSDESKNESTQLETYWKIHSNLQDQIKFADSKAALISAFNLACFAFLSSNFKLLGGAGWYCWIAPILYIIALAIVFCYLWRVVIPRTGERYADSKIFWGKIACSYNAEQNSYWNDTKNFDDEKWAQDLCDQIVGISRIAELKNAKIKKGVYFTLAALVLWVINFLQLSFLNACVTNQ